MPDLHLSHEYAERVVNLDVTGAPDVPSKFLCDDPAAVPPMRPARVQASYQSRNAAPWELETVQVRGTYAPADPASPWAGRVAGGMWLYPSSAGYPNAEKPQWTAELVRALAVPTPQVAAGPVIATAANDLAKRTRFFTLDGPDEITDWFMPAPLRPDKVRMVYLSDAGSAWTLDEIRFEGPHAATGKTPVPNAQRRRQSYYPSGGDSLLDAPVWVRDLADAHQVPDPLPEGQRA